MGRKKLEEKDIFPKRHYRSILVFIMAASNPDKKITFSHLKYALVKDARQRFTTKERKSKEDFFIALLSEGEKTELKKKPAATSIFDFNERLAHRTDKKFERVSNLWNFLDKLIELGFIEKKRHGKTKYYRLTRKGSLFMVEFVINSHVSKFIAGRMHNLDFSDKRQISKAHKLLTEFRKDIQQSIHRIITKYPKHDR